MDQKKHWDRISTTYEDEIFDVFKSDRHHRLSEYFKKHGSKASTAIDFGCGVGKAFEYLSPLFKSVLATDISTDCIELAKEKGYSNITYKVADLTSRKIKFPEADFAFCCNVIMLPEVNRNLNMIINIQKSLKSKGTAIIIVPALESAMFSTWRLIDWSAQEKIKPEEIDKSELSYFKRGKLDILQGLLDINGVTTKHYLHEELLVLFERANLTITKIDKIEYDWTSEFISPPNWMKAPYPWDWLVECQKK